MSKKQGHPAKQVDQGKKLERRVNDLMRQAVYLNQEMQTNHDLPQDIIEHAQASAASLMAIYAHLTGLPTPWDIRAAEMGWDKI